MKMKDIMKKAVLTSMEFTLEMDREYDHEKHYIRPGGYSLEGKRYDRQFDFNEFFIYTGENHHCSCGCDISNRKLVYVECCDPDTEDFPLLITPEDALTRDFNEFFIYTGGKGRPEIHPVALHSLNIIFDVGDGHTIGIETSADACKEIPVTDGRTQGGKEEK